MRGRFSSVGMATVVGVVVVIGLIAVGRAGAIGVDYAKDEKVTDANWPDALTGLANDAERVHAFAAGFSHVVFYQGQTVDLNRFLKKYAALEKLPTRVVIHPGDCHVRSPWDEKVRDVEGDWTLTAGLREVVRAQKGGGGIQPEMRVTTRVDVYLGGRITLADLRVPAGLRVESNGQIENFVKRHQQVAAAEKTDNVKTARVRLTHARRSETRGQHLIAVFERIDEKPGAAKRLTKSFPAHSHTPHEATLIAVIEGSLEAQEPGKHNTWRPALRPLELDLPVDDAGQPIVGHDAWAHCRVVRLGRETPSN